MLGNDPSNKVQIIYVSDETCHDKWGWRWYNGVCLQHQGMCNKSREQLCKSHNNIKACSFAYFHFPYGCSPLSVKWLI